MTHLVGELWCFFTGYAKPFECLKHCVLHATEGFSNLVLIGVGIFLEICFQFFGVIFLCGRFSGRFSSEPVSFLRFFHSFIVVSPIENCAAVLLMLLPSSMNFITSFLNLVEYDMFVCYIILCPLPSGLTIVSYKNSPL